MRPLLFAANAALVASPNDDCDNGSAFDFRYDGAMWTEVVSQKLMASDSMPK